MLEHLNEILDSTQITTSTAAVRLAISLCWAPLSGLNGNFAAGTLVCEPLP